MDKKQKRQTVIFGLVFFNLLIVFDWVQFGFGPPHGVLPKLVATVLVTVIFTVVTYRLRNQNKRGD